MRRGMGLGDLLGAFAGQHQHGLVGIFLGPFFLGAEETGGVKTTGRPGAADHHGDDDQQDHFHAPALFLLLGLRIVAHRSYPPG